VAFDDAVDGFGASVVGPPGGEVGHELVAPGPECAAESGDLGDRAAGERLQGGGGDPLTFRETGDEARDAQGGRAGDDVVGCGAVLLPGRVSAHAVPDVAHKSVGRLTWSAVV
jgi:hypothetical protein